jgi:putative transposase
VSQTVSPSTGRRYGRRRTCRALGVPRSTLYAVRARRQRPHPLQKRGPKTARSDAELTAQIRDALTRSPSVGEGYRKVWARLRIAGIRTSKGRVLRLMREAGLLAPTRVGQTHGRKAHDGTIIPDRPDAMWGTDATAGWTVEGLATIFIAVDQYTAECVGIHAARRGTRFEALKPLRQGIHAHLGAYQERIADGLALRYDRGSQFMSDLFQAELRFLGITSSPAFVREPEGNGCAERLIRTLKEQLLWVEHFATIEHLRQALLAFRECYNREWLIGRHGHRSPAAVREAFATEVAA